MLSSELELAMCAPGFFATRLLKVNYDRNQQYARIHSVLRDFIEVVEDQTLYTIPSERPALLEFLSQLETYLLELVMDEIVAFKNPAFEQEREWRIVARPRLIEMQRDRSEHDGANDNQTQGTTATPIQYRHSRGVLVPYLNLSPHENERLPIHSLRFGPSLNKFQTEYALRGFLLKHGYQNINVFGSNTPVIL